MTPEMMIGSVLSIVLIVLVAILACPGLGRRPTATFPPEPPEEPS